MGNGAAIKTGTRHATGEVLVFMDADGQHDPADIARLLAKLDEGYEMAVGARQADTHASLGRRLANHLYNRLASWMTGYPIEDLTSGFRVARARHFRKFLYLLPNGFSYPTTSTMAFFRAGFPVAYVSIRASQRGGKSHIRVLRDGSRFVLIILKIGALFSPMRFFLPLSLLFFCTGLGYYGYTYATMHRFTNMSAVLFIYSLLIFLIGMLSEQISALHYKGAEEDQRRTRRHEPRNLAAPRQHHPAGQDTPAVVADAVIERLPGGMKPPLK
jgi:glycosyltransferase involved in cell wall biosynthesis